MNIAQVAEAFGVGRTSIRESLARVGVAIRPRGRVPGRGDAARV